MIACRCRPTSSSALGSRVGAVAAIAAALCLLSSCVSMVAPRPGEPVRVEPGKALVFGRIRMLNARSEGTEYSPFRFDPWDQPFFAPGPRMTLELRQLYPPGGAFKYKAHPAPVIERNGSFFWILSSGEYVLLGNPRLLGSKRFNPEETGMLARFAVPASGRTIYLGTLIISVDYDLADTVHGWRTDEAEYTIRGSRIVDESELELSRLRERFPEIPEPVATGLMRAEE